MRRPVVPLLLLAVCATGMSACSDSELRQDQTADVLLTQEEFPLEGFTRGEVTEREPTEDGAESTASTDDSLAALIEGQDVPDACREALEATGLSDEGVVAQSSVTFSGESSGLLPTEAELVVATTDGTSPLDALATVNQECEELRLEESGVTTTLEFTELDNLDGTNIVIAFGDQELRLTVGGRTEASTLVAVSSTGVEEGDVEQIVQTQFDKIDAAD
ncbi:MAG: hypothetical protein ACR2FV_02205 [Ornithinimicrobium sp.]|uniref:hypothetical protein n=1 Tax=Ornithinimicrobium sp. TaxID=1977084 RepID=UPI003D9BD623